MRIAAIGDRYAPVKRSLFARRSVRFRGASGIAESYGPLTNEVLAGAAKRPDSQEIPGVCPDTRLPWSFTTIDMNYVIQHSERPRKNIVWHALPHPAPCAQPPEAIARQEAGVLKRCFQCGSLEAQ